MTQNTPSTTAELTDAPSVEEALAALTQAPGAPARRVGRRRTQVAAPTENHSAVNGVPAAAPVAESSAPPKVDVVKMAAAKARVASAVAPAAAAPAAAAPVVPATQAAEIAHNGAPVAPAAVKPERAAAP
ncbi:MAG: hypothetical protein JHD16_12740, partial [Solirubrobacteraceae bacterium]|nr:hypothetical protein [Solirubrobacteraceae bacterium]